jgi:hypothetical protein
MRNFKANCSSPSIQGSRAEPQEIRRHEKRRKRIGCLLYPVHHQKIPVGREKNDVLGVQPFHTDTRASRIGFFGHHQKARQNGFGDINNSGRGMAATFVSNVQAPCDFFQYFLQTITHVGQGVTQNTPARHDQNVLPNQTAAESVP